MKGSIWIKALSLLAILLIIVGSFGLEWLVCAGIVKLVSLVFGVDFYWRYATLLFMFFTILLMAYLFAEARR